MPLLISGCTGRAERQVSPETAAFRAFLKNEFQQYIPDVRTVYLLIPSGECEQCRASSLPSKEFFSRTGCILISSMAKIKKACPNSLLDYNNRLSTLTFIDYSPKVLVTNHGQIDRIFAYRDSVQLEKLK